MFKSLVVIAIALVIGGCAASPEPEPGTVSSPETNDGQRVLAGPLVDDDGTPIETRTCGAQERCGKQLPVETVACPSCAAGVPAKLTAAAAR